MTDVQVLLAHEAADTVFAVPQAALTQGGDQTRAAISLTAEGKLLAEGAGQQLVL